MMIKKDLIYRTNKLFYAQHKFYVNVIFCKLLKGSFCNGEQKINNFACKTSLNYKQIIKQKCIMFFRLRSNNFTNL